MNFSLKPNPLIAVWLPGFATLLAIVFFQKAEYDQTLGKIISTTDSTFSAIALLAFGFVIGNFLDAVRDILEELLFDKLSRMNWAFFVSGREEHLRNLEEWFYTWYELDINLAIGTILFFILRCNAIIEGPCWFVIALIAFFLVLVVSAYFMRREVKEQIDRVYPRCNNEENKSS